MSRGVRSAALTAASAIAVACSPDAVAPDACRGAEILSTTVAANELNVLSARVTTSVRLADSLAVRFSSTAELDGITPSSRPVSGDTNTVLPVLGLLPSREYAVHVVAYNQCGATDGQVEKFTTASLPTDLPSYSAGGSDPSPGYVVFAAGLYGLAIDNSGRVVWYRKFANGPGLNFQAQPNGRYAARPSPASPSEPATWVEVDVLGNVTRTLGCARDLVPRLHDLIAQPDGSYWILCDETRTLDLSATGGPAGARVTGTAVQLLSAGREVLFDWSPFDHLDIDYMAIEAADRGGSSINWTHGNALDLDRDGNLLVSFRNLSEVTKIDTRTGDVLWRMGGSRNQFQFGSAASPPFARQHGMRVSGRGLISLLDNLGDPAGSRARRFEYDEATKTSRLLESYGPDASVVATLGGTTQDLPNDRLLVSFGSAGRVEEYDANGNVVWRIEGNPGYVFRAQRIRSLYQPGIGLPR